MGNVTNVLNASIQVIDDADQSIIINRVLNNLNFDSQLMTGVIPLALPSTTTNIPLPVALCYQLYLRNKDSSGTILVAITTPQSGLIGGGSGKVDTFVLYPGDVMIVWQNPTSKNVNSGFSALSLFASNNNSLPTLCEYFIGA